ncbi:MAG TPA: V-type ATP synthase subunit D [Clostridiales bacterium]|nr:V-type ATP synthase subunit D [Clostridiales bacterium]
MARLNVNPTRMELSNLKTRLATANRGHKLLKDKQDELMRRFIELIKKNKALRLDVEKELESAFKEFLQASAVMSPEMMEEAVAIAIEEITVDIKKKNIMSVNVPVMDFERNNSHASAANIFPYGLAQTSSELDDAIIKLNNIMPKLLELAEIEKTCQLMADEIEGTRRRVNALEYRTIPDLEETIRYIRLKLDENERATITRLMKIKDIINS